MEEISKYIIAMKNILYGEGEFGWCCCPSNSPFPGEADPSPDLVTQLANEVYSNDLLSLFINNLSYLEFEVSFWALLDANRWFIVIKWAFESLDGTKTAAEAYYPGQKRRSISLQQPPSS